MHILWGWENKQRSCSWCYNTLFINIAKCLSLLFLVEKIDINLSHLKMYRNSQFYAMKNQIFLEMYRLF